MIGLAMHTSNEISQQEGTKGKKTGIQKLGFSRLVLGYTLCSIFSSHSAQLLWGIMQLVQMLWMHQTSCSVSLFTGPTFGTCGCALQHRMRRTESPLLSQPYLGRQNGKGVA